MRGKASGSKMPLRIFHYQSIGETQRKRERESCFRRHSNCDWCLIWPCDSIFFFYVYCGDIFCIWINGVWMLHCCRKYGCAAVRNKGLGLILIYNQSIAASFIFHQWKWDCQSNGSITNKSYYHYGHYIYTYTHSISLSNNSVFSYK